MPMLAALALTAALQSGTPPQALVIIEPAATELAVDETVQLQARLSGGAQPALVGLEPRWVTTDSDIVIVDEQGRVTALRPGAAQVSAVFSAAGQPAAVGFASIVVATLPAERLMWDALGTDLVVGTSTPTAVRGFDRVDTPLERLSVEYSSSDPEVATIDATGRIFAHGPGSALFEARADRATVSIEVLVRTGPLDVALSDGPEELKTGDVVRFTATNRAGGESLFPVWSVSGRGASIEDEGGEGVFVAEQPGTYRVMAWIGEGTALSTLVEVEQRTSESRLVQVGRGSIATHHSGDMWVFEGVDGRDYVYVGTFMHDWMKVFDVTDPAAPVLTDSIQLDARRINDVKIHPNNRLGLVTREGASDRRNGIVLLDLSTPAHPTIISEYVETVTGGVHNVWIDGQRDLVYAVHNGTSDIHILDISDPAATREIGRWGLDRANKTLHDVIVQDGYAFLSYWDDGVVILDVGAGTHGGTPTEPQFVSRYAYPVGNTHVAWRSGDYLFLGDEIFPEDWDADRPIEARGYIHVVDVSDIDNPHEVAFYEVPEAGAHNVWVEDEKLYVGYYQAGLRVVDISGELRGDLYAQGRELAVIKTTDAQTTVPNWSMTWGAQLFKGKIYSSDLNSGIWITELQARPRVVF